MRLLVHLLGGWIASEAAEGRYPRPVAVGLAMLVSRLGPPTIAMTLAALVFKRLREGGAFEQLLPPKRGTPTRRRRKTA